MTVTRWPQAVHRATWAKRFVPVPPPWGWVQSRSVSSRMCSGRLIGARLGGRTGPRSGRLLLYIAGMRARRRLVPMLTAAAVALPAATAHAQGAGDDQYQDPFRNTKSSSPKSQTHHQLAQAQSQPGLSQSPPATTPSAPAQTQSAASSSAPTAAGAPAATALPRTGM